MTTANATHLPPLGVHQPTKAQVPADLYTASERGRLRSYGDLARRLYPGPVGELVAREFDVWAEFGHRLGKTGLMQRLASWLEAESHRRTHEAAESAPEPSNRHPRPTTPAPARSGGYGRAECRCGHGGGDHRP